MGSSGCGMHNVEHEPGRPKGLVWVLVCVIGFVLITSGVLAVWFILLEEKTNQPWQVAAESRPGGQDLPQKGEPNADDFADKDSAGVKKDTPAPPSKDNEPV